MENKFKELANRSRRVSVRWRNGFIENRDIQICL